MSISKIKGVKLGHLTQNMRFLKNGKILPIIKANNGKSRDVVFTLAQVM